jgi:hypothetical protein
VSDLAFLSPGDAPAASPLARALAGAHGVRDLSSLGKLEVRRVDVAALEVDAEVIRITPTRALVVCPPERRAELRSRLPGLVVDVSGALAGIELESAELMRRLTDLDLDGLPSAGKVAGVPALVTREGSAFRVFFPQEYGDSVVETVRDLQEGLA